MYVCMYVSHTHLKQPRSIRIMMQTMSINLNIPLLANFTAFRHARKKQHTHFFDQARHGSHVPLAVIARQRRQHAQCPPQLRRRAAFQRHFQPFCSRFVRRFQRGDHEFGAGFDRCGRQVFREGTLLPRTCVHVTVCSPPHGAPRSQ